jgi:hypothetical protein
MPQANQVENLYDREMAAIVGAMNTIEAALDDVVRLLDDMEEAAMDEITGGHGRELPRWVSSAKPYLGFTEDSIEKAKSALDTLEEEIRQMDGHFRADIDEVYSLDADKMRKEYLRDREYLDDLDRHEGDEFFMRRFGTFEWRRE